MKKLLEYIRNSSIIFMIQLNPVGWLACSYDFEAPNDLFPDKYNFNVRFLMFRFSAQIDDGSW